MILLICVPEFPLTKDRRDDELPKASDVSKANDELLSRMSQQLRQFHASCRTSGSNLMFPVARSSPAFNHSAVQNPPPATVVASPPPASFESLRPASFVAPPPQTHARPLLAVIQQPVPPHYPGSKFVKFMRLRPNIRIHTTASIEVRKKLQKSQNQ